MRNRRPNSTPERHFMKSLAETDLIPTSGFEKKKKSTERNPAHPPQPI